MATDVIKLVKSVLAGKHAVAAKEKQLVDNLNRILPTMGYRVVPVGGLTPTAPRATRNGRPASKRPAPKSLTCPHCPRTFAHPLHLGRHVSATHGTKPRRSAAARRSGGRKKK